MNCPKCDAEALKARHQDTAAMVLVREIAHELNCNPAAAPQWIVEAVRKIVPLDGMKP